ncbi:hypothetical protein GWI33_023113, partial [Rhynchophorus ferrugineus]
MKKKSKRFRAIPEYTLRILGTAKPEHVIRSKMLNT